MRVSQIIRVKTTVLDVATLKLTNVGDMLQFARCTKCWRCFVGKHCNDELSRLESINDALYQITVAGSSDVALETDV